MNSITQFLVRFFQYAFLGIRKPPLRTVDINSVDIDRNSQAEPPPPSQEQVKIKLMIIINGLVGFVFVVSFLFMIVSTFWDLKNEKAFDTIRDAFLMTLSWFGGALTTFFGIDQNRNKDN